MKKSFLALIVVFFTFGNIYAQSFEAECPSGQTLKFKVIDSENLHVKVDSENDVAGALVIPETVTHNGRNYTVTQIGHSAFYTLSPSSYGPRTVTLPNTITVIGSDAFHNCQNLMEINLPSSIDSINSYAFYGCKKLTSITIPSSVRFLGMEIFNSCDRLTTVHYNAIDCKEALWPFRGCHFTDLILSDSVTRIPEIIFQYSDITGHLELPESVSYIGYSAFCDCDNITSVNIPHGVDTIDFSFSYCDNLDTVFYNATNAFSPTYTANGAFLSSGVRNVIFGEDVESLPAYIFCQCTNMDSISLPNSLKRIDDYAFSSCTSLTKFTIPENVEYIGDFAFYGCSNITTMNLKPITPPEIFQNTFYEVPTAIPITIPCHSGYPGTPFWNNFTNFIEDCSAVDENEATESAILYPNPATASVNIDLEDIISIEVYNNVGQKVLQSAQTKHIDLSGIPAGTYFIRITTKETSIVEELIKL
ncbi:MAG: leucine-rich repeat protein [Bacteroidales bacterium]|nr:leucine-rich repeat protein [Bacteroidales bacterium]